METKKKKKKGETERERNPLQNANMCNCDGSLGYTIYIPQKRT